MAVLEAEKNIAIFQPVTALSAISGLFLGQSLFSKNARTPVME